MANFTTAISMLDTFTVSAIDASLKRVLKFFALQSKNLYLDRESGTLGHLLRCWQDAVINVADILKTAVHANVLST